MDEFIEQLRAAVGMFGVTFTTTNRWDGQVYIYEGEVTIATVREQQSGRVQMLKSTFTRSRANGRYSGIERARTLYMKERVRRLEEFKEQKEWRERYDWANSIKAEGVRVGTDTCTVDDKKVHRYRVSIDCGDDQVKVMMMLDYLRDGGFIIDQQ